MTFERHRFMTNADDFRPVKFPPPGPYWCSGYRFDDDEPRNNHAIVIAILPKDEPLATWWPDAEDVETTEIDVITFTERFPRPTWWQPQLTVVPPT